MKSNEKVRRLTLAGMFVAIIIVMTVVPYTGYISYSPLSLSITTLHIPVILASLFLGWKYAAAVGGVWGLTCLVKAFIEPTVANVPFQNPLVSVMPRIAVGLVAAAVFALCCKKIIAPVSAIIATAAATLTNTVLVLSMLYLFNFFDGFAETVAAIFEAILSVYISVNGIIELVAAVILVPLLYTVLSKVRK